jgi:hypothetical protein
LFVSIILKPIRARNPLPLKKAILLAGCLSLTVFASSLSAQPVTISPPSRTQRVGDHLAFIAVASGAQPLAWQWQLNGTNLPGQTSSSLSLTNIQLTNAGTYSMRATLSSGPAPVATATLIVSNGALPLAATNLVVARVGDGLQSLNTTSGNTLYLDQFATNGNYVSTVMIPDSGASALIVEGGGASVGLDGSVLTLSSNQQYLNFAGYNQSLPNGGVTFTGSSLPRAIGAVNGLGYYVLCLTNNGLYDGAAGQIRCAVSVYGTFSDFWTAGIVSSPNQSVKTLTANQGSSGIPQNAAGYDPRVVDIFGGNLWVSSGNNSAGQTQGLYSFSGLPSGSPSSTAVLSVSTGANSDPNDFAFSPDGLTVYIADDDSFTTASGVGGIERWDYNGSAWVFNYSLGTGTGNWGARGLTVDFSQFPGGGSSARGAVIYATTAESSTNRLIRIADNSGSGSSATVLATAGPNQLFRGVRFAPPSQPSALESDADEVNVTAYGARGDGVTDDTAAFNSAIAATRSGSVHNGVYVPLGKYVISGTLTLDGVELVGNLAGGWPADTLPMPTLLMRVTTAPGLILSNGASLHGIAILYDQGTPTTTNAPAISLQGNGLSISSVRIQNPYDGINTLSNATPGRARFSDIYVVSPAHVGVQITKCYDYVQYHHIEVRCTNAMSTGAAFVFGRVDEGNYTGLLASNCLTGLEFDNDPSTNPAGGNFTGSFAGCSTIACANGVTITGAHKVKISGGDFSDSNYGAVINGAAEVTLIGGRWQTASGQSVQIVSATNVIIDASMFSRPAAVAAPLVTANNLTTLTLNHCQFLPGSTGLQLGAGVFRAIVIGNSFEDGGISNLMTSGQFIIGTNLITASAPSGLEAVAGSGQVALNWEIAVEATSYNVKRSLTNGGPYTTVASPAGLAYTDTGLTNGTAYYYVVSALRPAGQSANSSQVSATPQALDLGVSLYPGGNQLTLSWPGWASSFTLYMTTNLSQPVVWLPVTNAVQSNNGVFNLILPTTNGGQEFFQLGPP